MAIRIRVTRALAEVSTVPVHLVLNDFVFIVHIYRPIQMQMVHKFFALISIFSSLLRGHFAYVLYSARNLLFFTIIRSSIFNDCIVFHGIIFFQAVYSIFSRSTYKYFVFRRIESDHVLSSLDWNSSIYTRMWASAQPDGRPAEHRWRPLFNAAKFG